MPCHARSSLIAAALTDLSLAQLDPAGVPLGIHLWPFWILIGTALALAITSRDRLVLACWAAIIPLVTINWVFAATGWAQFGYRYGLDFMPFLFMLVVLAVRRVRWYHAALIGAAVLINLWGVLWIQKFQHVPPSGLFDWTWVSY